MRQPSSDDWLPPGWMVEMKLTSTGRKYKRYIHPSSGLKFYSKPQVSRYLNKARLKNRGSVEKKSIVRKTPIKTKALLAPIGEKKSIVRKTPVKKKALLAPIGEKKSIVRKTPVKTKALLAPIGEKKSIVRKTPIKTKALLAPIGENKSMKKKKRRSGSARNVVFERVTAEGLPPGWIKEIKIQKKYGIVRRDAYYTDPVSGYVFRSMKDTLRYLKTGDPGRLAFKPRSRDSGDINLEDDKTSSPVVPRKQDSAGGGAGRQITRGQRLKLDKIASDDEIPKAASSGECLLNSQHTSDQSKVPRGAKVTEKNSLYLSEAKGSKHVGEKSDTTENVLDSAPLVEPIAEKQPLENRVKLCGKRKTQPGLRNSRNKKSYDLPRRASKRLAGFEADVTPELKTSKQGRQVAAEPEPEPETKCSQPSQNMEVILESNNGNTSQEQAERVEAESKDKEKLKYPLSLPLGGGPIPIEHGGVAERENNAAKNPEPHPELPFGDSWTDPCIEFAIKTLTSDHLIIDEYFQQQLSSPHAQTDNGSNFGLGNLQQTDFPFQQYDVAENPAPKVLPTLQQDGNVSFPSSVKTGGCYQSGEGEKSNASLKVPAQMDNGLNLGLGNFHASDFSFHHFGVAENPASKTQAPMQPLFHPAGSASFLGSGETGLREPGEVKSKEQQEPTIQQEGNGSFPSSVATTTGGGLHQRGGEDKSKGYQKQLIY